MYFLRAELQSTLLFTTKSSIPRMLCYSLELCLSRNVAAHGIYQLPLLVTIVHRRLLAARKGLAEQRTEGI